MLLPQADPAGDFCIAGLVLVEGDVVTHAGGINFLLEGAKDKNGSPYAAAVDDLSLKGVDFRVCNFTLQSRNIDKSKVHSEAKIVPSGVAEVSRLQAQEGFVYLKP